jgi:orotate phosphoribosyltransferase
MHATAANTSTDELAAQIARDLILTGAFGSNLAQPFTWASGWRSPVYCDNRITLSYPDVRRRITDGLLAALAPQLTEIDAIAAVATGGIAQGAWLAERLGLPLVYIRAEAKAHGKGRQVEGHLAPAARVAVVEDLVSTGGSSLKAVEALRAEGADVRVLLCTFHYGFGVAYQRFAQAQVYVRSLCYLQHLLAELAHGQVLPSADLDAILAWQRDPANWQPIQP